MALEEGTFTARRNVERLREYAAAARTAPASRIELRFLRSPVAIRGDRTRRVDRVARNELYRDDVGALRARAASEETETIPCGLVLRSVGYRAVPLPDVPFDERAYVLPNDRGRVLTSRPASRCPGVYAVGWIKRGPTGILGTNKRDAEETVRALVEDLDGAAGGRGARASRDRSCWKSRDDVVTLEAGGDRPRGGRARARARAPAGEARRRATR